jgi:hypothetical protein
MRRVQVESRTCLHENGSPASDQMLIQSLEHPSALDSRIHLSSTMF